MKKQLILGICLLGSVFGFAQLPTDQNYVPGEVLVKIDDPDNLEGIIAETQIIGDHFTGLRPSRAVSAPVNIWLLVFDESAVSHEEMLAALYLNKHVLVAQNNHYVYERATVPNDPTFSSQWHHVNGSDKDIDSDLAWDVTTGGSTANGDEIVVCVLEGSGAVWSHTDLIANHWVNTGEIDGNGIDDDNNGYIDDYDGWNTTSNNDVIGSGSHGTSVSGMIGAVGDNGSGVVGANWNVKIMQVDMAGSLTEAAVIAAYTYPYVMRQMYNNSGGTEGAFVVATNASWGIDNANPASYPLWCDFYNTLGAEGILNCGATANNNVNIDVVGDMPTGCSSPYMISVTATNSSDVRTFSGYGQTTIDLGAPGQSVYSTTGTTGTGSVTGTSFASPLTAGVIALMYSAPCSDLADLALSDPQAAADLVRTALLDGVDPVANLTTECVTGGRLNANNSIQLILSGCGVPTCTMSASATETQASCSTSCDGEITITATGGSGSFTYDIGSGAQASNTFTGLCPGNYAVIVYDGDLCNESIPVTVTSPAGMAGSVATTHELTGNDGAINLTIIGGTPPYSYSWTGSGGFSSSSEDLTGLTAGTYSVVVTDNNGCTFSLTNITITSSVGLEELNNSIRIYPNPASEQFTISVNTADGITFELYDAAGKLILSEWITKTKTFSVSHFAKGIYSYQMSDGNGVQQSGKLVLQ